MKLLFRTSRTEHENRVREIAPHQVGRLKPHPVIIDIREEREYLLGHIEGSVHVSRNTLESTLLKIAPDRRTAIVIYCAVGKACASGAEALRRLGYRNIFSLKGGFRIGWRRAALLNAGQHRAIRDMPLVYAEVTEFENTLAAFKRRVAAGTSVGTLVGD